MSEHFALLASPDGETRAAIARTGDAFPLDPSAAIGAASTGGPSAVRPWGLRWAVTPPVRPRIAEQAATVVYDPARQQGVDPRTGAPTLGRHGGGTKETTGTPDGSEPSGEEATSD